MFFVIDFLSCLFSFLPVILSSFMVIAIVSSLCRYFPYEAENNHKLVREIGNVTKGLEITVQFAVKPEFMEGKAGDVVQTKSTLPYSLRWFLLPCRDCDLTVQ